MSSIVFNVTGEAATIAVDTMCTNEHGNFRSHVSKAFVVPHLKLVIAGTGWLDLIERFVFAVNRSGFSEHDEVALNASDFLAEIWEHRHASLGEPSAGTNPDAISSSVFQFGYSKESGTFEAVQFHSGNNFKAERMSNCFAYKPVTPLIGQPLEGHAELARVMFSQRIHEESKPHASRVHIGGGILVFTITEAGIAIQNIYSFDE